MVVCKFFLQGNCRFGDNCKFDHQINENRQHHSSILKQSLNVNTPSQTNTGTSVDTNTLIRAVINDATSAGNGGQWLLSCYAPFKEKPNFPGFEDQSFEEVRFGYYEAKHLGTMNQYMQQLQELLQSTMMKLRALQNPSQETINAIISIYNSVPNNTSNRSIFSSAANNIPLNAYGNNQNTVFTNQSNSVFGQSNNFNNVGVNQQPKSVGNSIFAAANNKLFNNVDLHQNSIFGNTQMFNNTFGPTNTAEQQGFASGPSEPLVTPQSINYFQVAKPQNVVNAFTSQPTNVGFNKQEGSSPFSSFGIQQQTNVFSQQIPNATFATTEKSGNPFAQGFANSAQSNTSSNSSFFGSSQSTVINTHSVKDETAYSKLEDLSEEDLKSFNSNQFEFGKIPEKPPTFEMCF